MTSIPDFATVPWGGPAPAAKSASPAGEPWLTPEGIAVKGAYGPGDRAG